MGIAGYSATVPTMRKFLATKSFPMTKYDHLALMAQSGVQAALLAQRGFTGDLEVLEGENTGFWRFAGGQGCDWDVLKTGLGTQWLLPQVTYKHFPAVLYTNSIIHEVRRLVAENHLVPDDIERLEVRSARVSEHANRPLPTQYLEAWGNSAYTIAAGVYDVRPLRSWEQPETFQRQDLAAFMEKISFAKLRDGEVASTGNYWERWAPIRVTLRARGQTIEGGRDYHLAMTDQDLVAKFHDNVGGLVTGEAARQLERACWDLEKLPRVDELTSILATADPLKA